jgi:predicted ArsR family transcriptional regulator
MSAETVSKAEAQRQVQLALRRVAMYHIAMTDTLVEQLGEEAGLKLAKAVADRYGEMVGRAARDRVQAQGKDNSLENYSEDLPLLGFEREQVSDRPCRRRVHNCPLFLTWRELGKEREGAIYCRVDQAKFKAYNPKLVCTHEVLAPRDQESYCQILVEETN